MSGVEEKKQERNKAKHLVTKASWRLTGAVSKDEDIDILRALMLELENTFDEFCDLNEEYETLVLGEENAQHRVVNGEHIPTYRENVHKTYKEARNTFIVSKEASQQAVQAKIPAATNAMPAALSVTESKPSTQAIDGHGT